jgi:hypothetical protein
LDGLFEDSQTWAPQARISATGIFDLDQVREPSLGGELRGLAEIPLHLLELLPGELAARIARLRAAPDNCGFCSFLILIMSSALRAVRISQAYRGERDPHQNRMTLGADGYMTKPSGKALVIEGANVP